MTKNQAIKKGWKFGRVVSGGYYAKKGTQMEAASTLKSLLSKISRR